MHISLGMQMSLMRKDNKLQTKQTKEQNMVNSLCESGERNVAQGSGLEIPGCNPCPGIV